MIYQNWFQNMKMVDETMVSQTFYDESAECFYIVSDDVMDMIHVMEISREDSSNVYYEMCNEYKIEYEREYDVFITVICNDAIRAKSKEEAIDKAKQMKNSFCVHKITAQEICY